MDNAAENPEVQEKKALITLDDARELCMYLEAGMQEEADNKFITLMHNYEPSLYNEVGTLTRDLHEAIRSFAEDPRLRDIADIEIPDASDRLRYIIKMTDKAANRTLDAVDACTPLVQKLTQSIDNLMPVWDRLMHGRIDRFEFVALCHQIDEMLNDTKGNVDVLSSQLNEILMAQDYQDLTGQMIQKVIALVTEVENELVKFLVSFSRIEGINPQLRSQSEQLLDEAKQVQKSIEAQGPATEQQVQSGAVMTSQDDVDDLLASLGF